MDGAPDPTLGQAMEALAKLEAAEAGGSKPPAQSAQDQSQAQSSPTAASAKDGQRAAEAPKPEGQTNSAKAGTEAPGAEQPDTKEQTPNANAKAESKFAKNHSRLEGGWRQLNEGKSALAKEREQLEASRRELEQHRQALQERQQRLAEPRWTPQEYDQAAAYWEQKARQLEQAGKFEESDGLVAQAKQARAYAQQLRQTPNANANTNGQPQAPAQAGAASQAQAQAQAEAKFKADQREWWGKAAVDYPAVAKAGTPEAALIKAVLTKTDPAYDQAIDAFVGNDPRAMYYLAQFVTAKVQAGKVSGLEKELGELRSKLKEYSERSAVPGDGAAATARGEIPFEQRSEAEQFAELQQMAAGMPR